MPTNITKEAVALFISDGKPFTLEDIEDHIKRTNPYRTPSPESIGAYIGQMVRKGKVMKVMRRYVNVGAYKDKKQWTYQGVKGCR